MKVHTMKKTRTVTIAFLEKFNRGYNETVLYKQAHGSANAPRSFVTDSGFRLGKWQDNIKLQYRKNRLSSENISRLEKIQFQWSDETREKSFEKGRLESLMYLQDKGKRSAPRNYVTETGYRLGYWQNNMRTLYKNGKLTPKQISTLESMGFIFDMNEDKFERGLKKTRELRKTTGDSNAPVHFVTSDNYDLWQWQANQRQNYRRGSLRPDRIKKLEALGFKWVLRSR